MTGLKNSTSSSKSVSVDGPGLVVGLGEALWDILPEGKQIGGAPANFAYHVGRFGLDSMVVSAVGDDPLGNELKSQFISRGLAFHLPYVPYPTGTVIVELDDQGVPSYIIKENVAWDNIPVSAELDSIAARTRAVAFGSLAQRNVVSRRTIYRFLDTMPRGEGIYRVFDINLRQHFYSLDVIEESLKRCNVFKINDEELVLISRLFELQGTDLSDKCRMILERYNLDILILTCGVNGSYVFSPGQVSFVETPKVDVVDTVGAGDSFTGTFIAQLLLGSDIRTAHMKAVEVSAFVCSCAGAMPEIPESLK